MKVQEQIETPKGGSFWRKAVHGLAIFALLMGIFPVGNRPAQAAFGSKTLTILHMHTGESATITFSRGGRYDQQALDQLNWLLRDWRTDEPIRMDPRLFDLLAEVYDESGSRQPIRVVSAYRSPKTNSMLRRRSKMVAEHSQHMLGKAMDFYLSDVSPEKIRAIGMKLQEGGVGYYPNANTPFTHLDVGGVRAWPRMTRAQLTSLFPSGKTVHIPADGTPLAGYEEAKAMILARGGKVAGESYREVADAQPKRKGFWATLFGGRDEEEDEDVQAPRGVFASRNRPQQVARNDDTDSDRPATFFNRQQRQTTTEEQPAPVKVAVTAPPPKPEPQPVAARDPVPLPPVRQVATVASTPSGPTMVWQAGSPGQPSSAKGNPFSAANTGSQIALAPNGGRKGGDDGLGSGVMTYAPLPPLRPGAATAAVARRGENLADAPITTASINHRAPMPPSRPTALRVKTAALAPTPEKPAKNAAKAVAPAKNTAPTKTATTVKAAAPEKNAKPEAKSAGPVKHNLLQPKPIATGGSGFSQTVSELSSNQFSGSAIKTTR